MPCNYFLINGMTGSERANIINQCLLKLHDIGIIACSITCDGSSYNFSMIEILGAKPDPPNMISLFAHPVDSYLHVHILLDACHMLKLMRNCLASYGVIVDETGSKIN